ncbi:phospholipase A and acyltransferase 4-like [Chelmon rostratus]|uniref:phospholipase A and acyltransferase 4-like n=1 Tax=Chelmon rostratus TaxID=109905 RepID=UPI001BE8B447|nr:phospholipase A and acyltransferase 4-like [Chelmon rostratus]
MDEIMHSAKPGDLIEIFHEIYEHWAVYIGGDEVVHLSPQTQVKRQKISEVVGLRKCRVNNLLDCKYRPRDRHIIVTEAKRLVGQELPYSVITHNCEHFVTRLRYNKPESQQVERAAAVIVGTFLIVVSMTVLENVLSAMFRGYNENRDYK